MIKEPPQITIYSRTIDNVTNKEIEGYKLVTSKSNFHYGEISGIDGGESEFVVEFDIWNNEPSFYGGMYTQEVSNAINCKFTAWDNQKANTSFGIRNLIDNKPYIMARCVTRNFEDFKPIAGNVCLAPNNLFGSISNDYGLLLGNQGGDHMKIQTKISIPPQTKDKFKTFIFEFSYDYV